MTESMEMQVNGTCAHETENIPEVKDIFADRLPENINQPKIFDLIKQETLRKMGKLSKEAALQKALTKAIFIRDAETPNPPFDTSNDEFPTLPERISNGTEYPNCEGLSCRLGCICESINSEDMYDENYERHCRDTGDPNCMFGCVCEHPGPHLNGESNKWVTPRPYKYKKPRVRDDEDCGFVPMHLREVIAEGRPKRKAQAPTRYRPDFSISEKELRAIDNNTNNNNTNYANEKTSRSLNRPRRRLYEQEDEDSESDNSDERIIKDKKRVTSKSGNSGSVSADSTPPKKQRIITRTQVVRNLREPSKRERKPKKLDLPDPEPPRRKKPVKKGKLVNGHISNASNATSSLSSQKKDRDGEQQEVKVNKFVEIGTSLHLIGIQPASRTCQGMYAILRNTTNIISTFVSWDEGGNKRPYLMELKYKFTSSRSNQSFLQEGHDILYLPYNRNEDTMWIFYLAKKNLSNWDHIICPDLHAVIQVDLLLEIIKKYREGAIKSKLSKILDISQLNMNKREDMTFRPRGLYLYLGKYGDVFWFGTPPRIFVQKNLQNVSKLSNVLFKPRQAISNRSPSKKPKVLGGGTSVIFPLPTPKDPSQIEKKYGGKVQLPVLTTPEVFPPSPPVPLQIQSNLESTETQPEFLVEQKSQCVETT